MITLRLLFFLLIGSPVLFGMQNPLAPAPVAAQAARGEIPVVPPAAQQGNLLQNLAARVNEIQQKINQRVAAIAAQPNNAVNPREQEALNTLGALCNVGRNVIARNAQAQLGNDETILVRQLDVILAGSSGVLDRVQNHPILAAGANMDPAQMQAAAMQALENLNPGFLQAAQAAGGGALNPQALAGLINQAGGAVPAAGVAPQAAQNQAAMQAPLQQALAQFAGNPQALAPFAQAAGINPQMLAGLMGQAAPQNGPAFPINDEVVGLLTAEQFATAAYRGERNVIEHVATRYPQLLNRFVNPAFPLAMSAAGYIAEGLASARDCFRLMLERGARYTFEIEVPEQRNARVPYHHYLCARVDTDVVKQQRIIELQRILCDHITRAGQQPPAITPQPVAGAVQGQSSRSWKRAAAWTLGITTVGGLALLLLRKRNQARQAENKPVVVQPKVA